MIDSHRPSSTPGSGERRTYRLRLRSGSHDWRFAYAEGEEAHVAAIITAMARDPQCPLDWASATRLLRAITQPATTSLPHSGTHAGPLAPLGFGQD
jgi:hypothetical protein